jgi:hypothetical protein
MSYFNAQSWYPKQWMLTLGDYLCKYNVDVATYGILNQTVQPPALLNETSAMWVLNFVFNGRLFGLDSNGLDDTNPLVYNEFDVLAKKDNLCSPTALKQLSNSINDCTVVINKHADVVILDSKMNSDNSMYNLYNLNGSLLAQGLYNKQGINVGSLTNGVYFIQVECCNNQVLKFYKVRLF